MKVHDADTRAFVRGDSKLLGGLKAELGGFSHFSHFSSSRFMALSQGLWLLGAGGAEDEGLEGKKLTIETRCIFGGVFRYLEIESRLYLEVHGISISMYLWLYKTMFLCGKHYRCVLFSKRRGLGAVRTWWKTWSAVATTNGQKELAWSGRSRRSRDGLTESMGT